MTLEGDNFVRIRHEPVTWSSTGQGPYRGVRMNLPRLRAHLSVTAKGSPGLGSDCVCYYLAVLLIKRASEGMGKCGKLAALSEAPSLMRNLLPGSPTPVFSLFCARVKSDTHDVDSGAPFCLYRAAGFSDSPNAEENESAASNVCVCCRMLASLLS